MTAKIGLLSLFEPKAGKAGELAELLRESLPLARDEDLTVSWHAFSTEDGRFGVFSTYEDRAGLDAHRSGKIAQSFAPRAPELIARETHTVIDLLAVK
jgi:quinol monooxygenase YgiN